MKQFVYASVLFVSPLLVAAQIGPAGGNFGEVDTFFLRVLAFIDTILVPLIFALALLVFIYGMFKYFVLGGGNAEEQEKGKQLALWAIIGFVLMVSIWGIVNIIAGGLFPGATPPTLPGTPGAP